MAYVPRCEGFELDPRRFMRDTRGWTAEQVGVYFRLLCNGWRDLDRPGHFPADNDALRSLSGSTDAEWNRARAVILSAMKSRGGVLVQEGQAREHDRQTASIQRTKAQKAAAANSRWHNDKTCTRIAPAMHPQCGSNASFSPSLLTPESKEESKRGEAVAARPRRRRPKGEPDRSIPEGFTQRISERLGLPLAHVDLLAEKVLLEFDARGLVSAQATVIRWAERDARRAAQGSPITTTPEQPYRHPLTDQLEQYEREHPE